MRKKTVYQVTGVGDSEPKDLPEGFKVEQLEIDDIETLEIRAFRFEDSGMHENGVYIREDRTSLTGRHLTKEETRKVRDFFNKILGEETNRVVVDRHNDLWFELLPGLFTLGCDVSVADDQARERAEERQREGSFYKDKTLEWVSEQYGPIKDHKG